MKRVILISGLIGLWLVLGVGINTVFAEQSSYDTRGTTMPAIDKKYLAEVLNRPDILGAKWAWTIKNKIVVIDWGDYIEAFSFDLGQAQAHLSQSKFQYRCPMIVDKGKELRDFSWLYKLIDELAGNWSKDDAWALAHLLMDERLWQQAMKPIVKVGNNFFIWGDESVGKYAVDWFLERLDGVREAFDVMTALYYFIIEQPTIEHVSVRNILYYAEKYGHELETIDFLESLLHAEWSSTKTKDASTWNIQAAINILRRDINFPVDPNPYVMPSVYSDY